MQLARASSAARAAAWTHTSAFIRINGAIPTIAVVPVVRRVYTRAAVLAQPQSQGPSSPAASGKPAAAASAPGSPSAASSSPAGGASGASPQQSSSASSSSSTTSHPWFDLPLDEHPRITAARILASEDAAKARFKQDLLTRVFAIGIIGALLWVTSNAIAKSHNEPISHNPFKLGQHGPARPERPTHFEQMQRQQQQQQQQPHAPPAKP